MILSESKNGSNKMDPSKTNNRILTAMSGGVDSSAAALLLSERGYDVSGVTFRLYEESEADLESVRDAEAAAQAIGIPHYIYDFRDYFKENVIKPFAETYVIGDTPNPCVTCNKTVKFLKMEQIAEELDAAYISTGHYAKTDYNSGSGRYLLLRASDTKKDQSYVLYNLTQHQLAMLKLPLGSLTKTEIREIASHHGMANAQKSDSQDICFVKNGDYAGFLRNKCGITSSPGRFVMLADGTDLGEHKGIINYTIGQRKGLGVSGGRPLFVVSKDLSANNIVLGDSPDLFSKRVFVKDINYIALARLESDIRVTAKLRYSQKESPAVIHPISDSEAVLEFEETQRAVTTGQSAVFYDGDAVVGGGVISGCDK